jgi:hypothetical protein
LAKVCKIVRILPRCRLFVTQSKAMKKISLFFFLLNLYFISFAQIANEAWRVHLPYQSNNAITAVGTKLYAGSPSGLFTVDLATGEVERLSKIQGFSDVEVKFVKHHQELGQTVMIYQNANVDIIDHAQNRIINVPDIFMKQIIGEKSINGLCFYEDKVYLACSFGIVVLDLVKKQIIDSYQNLGLGGTNLSFNAISIFQGGIYASANDGIYRASLTAPNLSDFNFWSKILSSTQNNFSEVFKGNLYAQIDSIVKMYDGFTWTDYLPSKALSVKNLRLGAYGTANASFNKLLVITENGILVEEGNGAPWEIKESFRRDAAIDYKGRVAMVDGIFGITIHNKSDNSLDYYIPNGPVSKTFARMMYEPGKLWVTGGSVNDRWDPLVFNNSKFYQFKQNAWVNFNETQHPLLNEIKDIIDVKKNPYTGEVYVSSFGNGVLEVKNDVVVKHYTESNSSLQRLDIGNPSYRPLLTGGMDFDLKGNLWVSNYGVNKPLSVKTLNGTWYSFNIGTLVGNNELGWLTCDDYNNKWVTTLRDRGILVYNDNGTPANANDDKYKLITKEVGQGALPSNSVLCVSKDLNGEMWIGTTQGLAIISNPNQIFGSDKDKFDARQIIIKVGSNYEIFLGKEQINCIKVDPANRKWIGTPNGVWLVSEDGYTVIRNFTTANAPLLSNNVMEIGIDESSGEVFFGTEKGIISYMGDATLGATEFGKVEIFPNPVKPDFFGNVSIRGLIDNCTVKITDIAGNLVYETTSNGGFATWNGNNFNGRRVATGVYIVFAASKDGSKSYSGKILFIN